MNKRYMNADGPDANGTTTTPMPNAPANYMPSTGGTFTVSDQWKKDYRTLAICGITGAAIGGAVAYSIKKPILLFSVIGLIAGALTASVITGKKL